MKIKINARQVNPKTSSEVDTQAQATYLKSLINSVPKSEAQLQSQCAEILYWFYPEYRKRLICIFNNSLRANTQGFGIVPGVSDMLFIDNNGRVKFIEFKFGPNSRISDAQKEFRCLCGILGHKYYICDSMALFWLIIGLKQPDENDIDKAIADLSKK